MCAFVLPCDSLAWIIENLSACFAVPHEKLRTTPTLKRFSTHTRTCASGEGLDHDSWSWVWRRRGRKLIYVSQLGSVGSRYSVDSHVSSSWHHGRAASSLASAHNGTYRLKKEARGKLGAAAALLYKKSDPDGQLHGLEHVESNSQRDACIIRGNNPCCDTLILLCTFIQHFRDPSSV